jgi:hypothetical protein
MPYISNDKQAILITNQINRTNLFNCLIGRFLPPGNGV